MRAEAVRDHDASSRWPIPVQRLGFTRAQSIWQDHSRDHRRLLLGRSAPILRVPFSYRDLNQIKEALLAAGFDSIKASVLRHAQPVRDFGAFARAAVFGNPVLRQITQRGGASPETTRRAVADALRKDLGPMPLQMILVEAHKPA